MTSRSGQTSTVSSLPSIVDEIRKEIEEFEVLRDRPLYVSWRYRGSMNCFGEDYYVSSADQRHYLRTTYDSRVKELAKRVRRA